MRKRQQFRTITRSIMISLLGAFLIIRPPHNVMGSRVDDKFTSCSTNLMLSSDFSFNGALNELEFKILLEEMAPVSCNILEGYSNIEGESKFKNEWNNIRCLCTDVNNDIRQQQNDESTQQKQQQLSQQKPLSLTTCCSTQLDLEPLYYPNPPSIFAQICRTLDSLVHEQCNTNAIIIQSQFPKSVSLSTVEPSTAAYVVTTVTSEVAATHSSVTPNVPQANSNSESAISSFTRGGTGNEDKKGKHEQEESLPTSSLSTFRDTVSYTIRGSENENNNNLQEMMVGSTTDSFDLTNNSASSSEEEGDITMVKENNATSSSSLDKISTGVFFGIVCIVIMMVSATLGYALLLHKKRDNCNNVMEEKNCVSDMDPMQDIINTVGQHNNIMCKVKIINRIRSENSLVIDNTEQDMTGTNNNDDVIGSFAPRRNDNISSSFSHHNSSIFDTPYGDENDNINDNDVESFAGTPYGDGNDDDNIHDDDDDDVESFADDDDDDVELQQSIIDDVYIFSDEIEDESNSNNNNQQQSSVRLSTTKTRRINNIRFNSLLDKKITISPSLFGPSASKKSIIESNANNITTIDRNIRNTISKQDADQLSEGKLDSSSVLLQKIRKAPLLNRPISSQQKMKKSSNEPRLPKSMINNNKSPKMH